MPKYFPISIRAYKGYIQNVHPHLAKTRNYALQQIFTKGFWLVRGKSPALRI